MNLINIIRPGSDISLWTGDAKYVPVPAKIIAAMVDEEGIQYKVAYWNQAHLIQEWINQSLIFTKKPEQQKIGFTNES